MYFQMLPGWLSPASILTSSSLHLRQEYPLRKIERIAHLSVKVRQPGVVI